MFKRIVSLTVSLGLLLQQTVFAYTASLNLSAYLNPGPNLTVSDRFRPVSLRYFSYQPLTNDFKVLLDKGDTKDIADTNLKGSASVLLDYFKIGLSLPNDKFWVNLRPDSEDEIIDQELAKTDLGKIMLEADLKLKQDTALFTSPSTPQGKEYWNRLYKRAGELFGTENITIPTLTRPWIVPGEIILRESADKDNQASGAYIYKANLKVMLEEDYLGGGSRTAPTSGSRTAPTSAFSDPRLKELNQYSTQLIRELILPRLTQKVNSSKDYANLRQVYFSLILARWFKETFSSQFTADSSENDSYIKLIDSNNLTNLTSKQAWDKATYFNAYQKSFQEGEYNLSEPIYTPTGQVIRRYMSGGISDLMPQSLKANGAGIYVGGPDSIVSSAIMTSETQVFFTDKELSQKRFIDSKKRVLKIFYPVDSGLANLTEYALKFNDILGLNKSLLNEEEKTSIDNLLKRIREKREQVEAIKAELTVIPEGAAEPLASLGAAWKILNKTQAFLIDEAKNLLKITNAIQSLISHENGKYLNLRKEALETIIKNLSGRVLITNEIESKDSLIDSLGNLKKKSVRVKAKCLLSFVYGNAYNKDIDIEFNQGGNIFLFSNVSTQPVIELKIGWKKLEKIVARDIYWESAISNLSPEGAYNLVGAIEDALERANEASSAVEVKEVRGSGSPLVKDEKLAQGLQGVTFGLIEKEFKNVEMVRNVQSIINIGDNYYRLKFSAANSVPLGKAPKDYKSRDQYKIIELFPAPENAIDSNVELVLQIKVYKSGYISALVSKDLNADERTIIAAVIRQSFQTESLIILEDLFKKAGLNPEMVKTALGKHLGWKEKSMDYGEFNEHRDISWGRQINPLTINFKTMSNSFSLSEIEINDTLPRKEGYKIILLNPNDDQARLSISLYENGPMAFGFWEKFSGLSKSNNSYQIQNNIVETVMESLGVSISPNYSQFRDKLTKALNAVKSSSALEVSKKIEGPAIISAVKSLQDKLPDDGNEQLLKFAANVNPNGELEYPIKKDDNVMIGHVRGDRAGYLALGLQARGFEKLLGYIKFNKDFKGVSVLPEEAVGKISNTFFEGISDLGYTSVKISEDEKKEHTGYNANGRNEQPFAGERRVVIKMQKSSKAYVDTPEMRMKEVADAVLAELDGNVDFILTNFLSSDMMKHTGNFEAAKKSNEISDRQLGRIKERIDAIEEAVLEEMQDAVNYRIPESEEKIHLLRLLTDNYDKFLRIVSKKYSDVLYTIKMLEKEIPLLVITADHGASEEGLKENPKESDTFHSANPVPYIIYDPLRKQKVPLKEGKNIRNNAATLLQLLGEKIPQEYDESLLPADYQGSKRRIVFAVLDGWGINSNQDYSYDAIRLADTPNYDWFVKNAFFTQLEARGEVIGLRKTLSYEEGPHHLRGLQAGQTDIGHIHLFSGREVKQPLWYVDQLIQGGLSNGVFDETKEEVKLLIRELNEVKEKGSKFNYITVGSEGGVHASLYHMYALMRLAKKVGLEKDQFVIHFGADGRDVPTRTAHLYLEDVYKRIEEIGIGVVSVVFGRDMLVRKEGAENITNRLIDVLSGDNLKDDDVTLIKETPQGQTTTGSPLTVEDLKKIEWRNVLFDSLQEIFEERIKKIDEYHGKLFVMENFRDPFIMARYDKQKIGVIEKAIEEARLYWEAPSETEQANRKELRNFLTGSLDSYCQKILSEIKEAFSDSRLKFLSNDVSTATADRKKKRDFLLKQINEIEAYYFGKKGPDVDYRGAFSMPGRLNWAIRVHKMIQNKVPLNNILEQSVPNSSSAMMSEDQSGQTSRQTVKNIVGGIDFRQMNMLIQPQGSFASSSLDFSLPALSKAEIESFDLDTELAAIQRMASSGIAPSYQRLKEYLAVCFAKERTGKEIDSLKLCLLDIFEKEQFEAKETPNGYKEVLVIADTKGYVLRESRLAGRGQNSYSLN